MSPADSLGLLEQYGAVILPALTVAEQVGVPLPARHSQPQRMRIPSCSGISRYPPRSGKCLARCPVFSSQKLPPRNR